MSAANELHMSNTKQNSVNSSVNVQNKFIHEYLSYGNDLSICV